MDIYADFTGPAPLPDDPTTTLPGTAARMRVYRQRASRRQQLHHAQDVQCSHSGAALEQVLRAQIDAAPGDSRRGTRARPSRPRREEVDSDS
jgi:hypothetical protein